MRHILNLVALAVILLGVAMIETNDNQWGLAVISVKEYYNKGVKTYNKEITLEELEGIKQVIKKYNPISV